MSEPRKPAGAIFDAAIELPPEGRTAYVLEACAGDEPLRQRVEALIRAHELAGTFMEGPATHPKIQTIVIKPAEQLGDRIGRYKILQQIGEGGCGVVYVAEQAEPVRRRVALKVIKLGMDTRNVIARFEAERQALALMDHPNIAKVLDAGATESGRPYFAMELVKGIPFTRYCDEHKLSIRERLNLFIQVCQAVQHAHQKGIIHRDIKPSNILVADHDGVPVPKVIDFGIAKATTDQRLTDKTIYTAIEQFIGTPAYMSPEQANLSGLDIDTRSDIYSLGVLLYELLTGRTPFDAHDLVKSGLEAIRRTIREVEPPRPSTRLSTLQGEALAVTAKQHGSEGLQLVKMLRGDLDWIVMKCLEKDRSRRYDTANGLAMDIRRHLGNEPIIARPPSTTYRLQKAWRRHKTALSVTMLIAVMLVAATGISVWQAVLAKQRQAESEAISKFLREVLQSPDPTRNGRTITVAEMLDRAVTNLDHDLAAQPDVRAQLQATLGATFFSLGLYREAIPLQEKARDYCLKTFGLEETNTLAAINLLVKSYLQVDRSDDALKLAEEVVPLMRKVLGPEHPDTLTAMQNLATSYGDVGRRDEALKLREELVTLHSKVLGPEHPATLDAMKNLAVSYADAGRKDEALKLREKVLTLRHKVLGPEHRNTLQAMGNLAASYYDAGDKDEALNLREEVLTLRRKVLGPEHPATLDAMKNLAASYADAGRKDEALKLREEALTLGRKVLGPEHPDTIFAMGNLANSYLDDGRPREAIPLLEKLCELSPKLTDVAADGSLLLATLQTWFGEDAKYEATRRRFIQQAVGTDEAGTAERAAKAASLRPSTDPALATNALNLARRAVELGKGSPALPWHQLTLGMAEYRAGQYAAAERSLTIAEQTAGAERTFDGYVQIPPIVHLFHAMTLFRLDRVEEARKLFGQAQTQLPPFPKDDNNPVVPGKRFDPDIVLMWLACKEAKALIEVPSVPIAQPSPPK